MNDHVQAFVAGLMALEKSGDKGALAALRRGIGRRPGEVVEMLPYVVPYLPPVGPNVSDKVHGMYFLVAALFATHPTDSGTSMGAAFHRMAVKEKIVAKEKTTDSLEKRFMALLDSSPEDIGGHLRHAVSLLASHEIPLDYERLLRDMLAWDAESRHVQMRWASEFWTQTGSRSSDKSGDKAAPVEKKE